MIFNKKIIYLFYFITISVLFNPEIKSQTKETYNEIYRPQFHFTPAKNWMNDPNGLVYYNKIYHLFFQYNPFGNKWGHMSWGHAISKDLVHWKELPVAIPEENGIMAFSGSSVVDWDNSSGFEKDGEPPLVAIYTGRRDTDNTQYQCLAYSNDSGETWAEYKNNPVININSKDFRDPKVFWYSPDKKWVMVVALSAEHKIRLYESLNLKKWKLMSEFGPAGAIDGVWECPDLFPLKVDDNGQKIKWVLDVNLGSGSVAGGSGAQYFVGNFDGKKFTADKEFLSSKKLKNNTPQGIMIADFEGRNYGDWKVTGDAFGNLPAKGSLKNQGTFTGYIGKGLVNSFHGGDVSTGTLTSPSFKIKDKYISFLIGGGHHPNTTCINLLIGGKVVRKSTGKNNENLEWNSWDVNQYLTKDATIQIVDNDKGGWGHINIDQIMQTNRVITIEKNNAHWVDYGKDFYAAVSYSDIPAKDGRRIWIGWMSNWQYAQDLPTNPWRNAQSIPRSLSLKTFTDGIRLIQKPVNELSELRGEKFQFKDITLGENNRLFEAKDLKGSTLEIEAEIELGTSNNFGFEVRKGDDQKTIIGYNVLKHSLFIDRSKSGDTKFNDQFTGIQTAPLMPESKKIRLHIFIDKSSLEVFANEGEIVMTDLIFPSESSSGLDFFVKGGEVQIKKLSVWKLRSIWEK